MVLMANRPMLSLKRAREIRRRNAATKLQSHARAFVGANRLHQMKWAAFLLQVTREVFRSGMGLSKPVRQEVAVGKNKSDHAKWG